MPALRAPGLFPFKGMKMLLPLGLLLAALPLGRCIPLQQAPNRSKLLLVSFDGFRWNYDQDVDTPSLDAMAAAGVKAQHMIPAFITLTSPCHFTLLTDFPILGNVQGQAGQGLESAWSGGRCPCPWQRGGMGRFLRSLQTQTVLGFHELNLYLSKVNNTRPTR
uniref:Ectonucleotide pyrophosphatase/phosphodiesterase 7 n=1 Tax=Taeniopygia guttata TaxID=59729 RepID=A0A674HQ48_TAEGU